jgi:hypothetical protein
MTYDWTSRGYSFEPLDDVDRAMVNKYWENLPDYLDGSDMSMMCVIDTSGSMMSDMASAPINVAIGLGIYCAERMTGDFANHFISFSENPQFIELDGVDFVDKAQRVYLKSEVANTDLVKTFDLIKSIALKSEEAAAAMPKTLVVISDMEIDMGSDWAKSDNSCYWKDSVTAETEMERLRKEWAADGLTLPHLVYWNVEARNDIFLEDAGENVTFVSGCSPIIFKSVVTGKTGYELMLDILLSNRYKDINGRV